jgi:predicted RNA-binding Zn-ribbon protein involved in translation (DUF1610 family)
MNIYFRVRKSLNISSINLFCRNKMIDMSKSNLGYRDPKILEELYWKRNLSLREIAKLFSLKSDKTILNYMKKFNIPRRPSDRRDYPKLLFSENLSEKAYLIGLRAGDIYVHKKGKLIGVDTTSSKEALIKMLKNIFEKYTRVNIREVTGKNAGITGKEWKFSCWLHPSFEFLVEKPLSIPSWILKDTNSFYSFLAGYADSEGSWVITEHKKYNGKYKDIFFSLGSCDKTILEQIHERLKELGFHSHLYLVRKAGVNTGIGICNFDLYRVMILRAKEVVKLAKILLPLSQHEEKKEDMLEIIALEPFFKRTSSIDVSCPLCGHEKLWRCGFIVSKNKKYLRYRCPKCKKCFSGKKLKRVRLEHANN